MCDPVWYWAIQQSGGILPILICFNMLLIWWMYLGDPQQLPATVHSHTAITYNYDQSLMMRLQLCGFRPLLLNQQYRMHPEIRQFPSRKFYNNKVIDGEGISPASRLQSFHSRRFMRPYLFFNVEGVEEARRRGNHDMCITLTSTWSKGDADSHILFILTGTCDYREIVSCQLRGSQVCNGDGPVPKQALFQWMQDDFGRVEPS